MTDREQEEGITVSSTELFVVVYIWLVCSGDPAVSDSTPFFPCGLWCPPVTTDYLYRLRGGV